MMQVQVGIVTVTKPRQFWAAVLFCAVELQSLSVYPVSIHSGNLDLPQLLESFESIYQKDSFRLIQ